MPLSDLRVIEVCGGVAAAYAGSLFADLGADVRLVGHEARPELQPRGSDSLASGLWQSLHRNKVPGGGMPSGTAEWERLLAGCDLLIVQGGPAEIAALHLPDSLPARLVAIAISHFGQTGLRAGWRGSELVDIAYGGGCNKNGEPGRAPA